MNLIVSLHDVHPSSLAAVAQQRADLFARGVRRFSLLVVPRWHGCESVETDASFVRTISQWQEEGDEVLLHGWKHSCMGLTESVTDWFWTRLYTAGEAEFHLADLGETRMRITTGRDVFDRLKWNVTGFVAPAWRMAPHTIPTLRELGFAYTVTRPFVIPLVTGSRPIASTTLSYSTRSRWRRLASLVWNFSLAHQLRHAPLMRISLHPGDIAYPVIWDQICRTTEAAIRAGRTAQTYRDCAKAEAGPHPLIGGIPRVA